MYALKPLSAVKLWKDSDIRKRCFSNFKCNAYALIQYVKRIASNWNSPPVFGSTLLPWALSIRTVSGASSITRNKICFHSQFSYNHTRLTFDKIFSRYLNIGNSNLIWSLQKHSPYHNVLGGFPLIVMQVLVLWSGGTPPTHILF